MTVQTLEQKRAKDAWDKSGRGVGKHGKDYVNLSKGLPALIMSSGLMQVMAFLHQKNEPVHRQVAEDLRSWLHAQCGTPRDFEQFMEDMLATEVPLRYQTVTTETFAWLKWLREMAAARHGG